MLTIDRRRRRRPVAVVLAAVLIAALVLALLIGGALRVGRASGPYWSDINRSYAAQGDPLVVQSNETGARLRTLMGRMPDLGRATLQQLLDSLVAAGAQGSATGAALTPPTPSGGVGPQLATVLADRARALTEVRTAVDGLLGMAPLPVVGAATSATTATTAGRPTTLLSAAAAAADITGAGSLLQSADRSYATLRHQFRSAPGTPALPRSVWVTHPTSWSAGAVQSLVNRLTSSSSLAAEHRVVLLGNGIRLTPPAVPPATASAPAGTSTVTPTHHLAVTTVVANQGNVEEPRVTVTVSVQGGSAQSRTVSLAAGQSQAVLLPPLAVVPGRSYTLTVSVAPPAGQTERTGTSTTFTVKVAPA